MFNTSNTTVSTGGGKYLNPGINDDVILVNFTSGESAKATPFLEVMVAKNGEPDNTAKDKFYFSEKAQDKSLEKIVHILQDGAGIARADIDKAGMEATGLEDYAKRLSALAKKGKPFRMKFSSEEYLKDGEVKTAKRIGFTPFAESMDVKVSGLKYELTNKYDHTPLPADQRPGNASAPAGINDLPF